MFAWGYNLGLTDSLVISIGRRPRRIGSTFMQSGLPPRPIAHRPLYTANILGTAIALFTLVGPLLIINRYAPERAEPSAQTAVSAKQP
jgi:hypothetical protein